MQHAGATGRTKANSCQLCLRDGINSMMVEFCVYRHGCMWRGDSNGGGWLLCFGKGGQSEVDTQAGNAQTVSNSEDADELLQLLLDLFYGHERGNISTVHSQYARNASSRPANHLTKAGGWLFIDFLVDVATTAFYSLSACFLGRRTRGLWGNTYKQCPVFLVRLR